jgi:hypothetical protein
MSFSRPIQWYNSHVDKIWPDGIPINDDNNFVLCESCDQVTSNLKEHHLELMTPDSLARAVTHKPTSTLAVNIIYIYIYIYIHIRGFLI